MIGSDEVAARRSLRAVASASLEPHGRASTCGDARSSDMWRVILGRMTSKVPRLRRHSTRASSATKGLAEFVPISPAGVAPALATETPTLRRVLEVLRSC